MAVVIGKLNIISFEQFIHFIEELLPSNPLLAIFLQASCDESPHSQRYSNGRIEEEASIVDSVDKRGDGVGLEWAMAVQHLVENDSN